MFRGSLIANLGGDVELKYAGNGTAVANFSVATSESVRNKDGEYQDQTTWTRCTVFGKLAENCSKYLSKGSKVYLEGGVRLDEWLDKEGNKQKSLSLTVSNVQFLDGISKAQAATNGSPQETKEDADCPF